MYGIRYGKLEIQIPFVALGFILFALWVYHYDPGFSIISLMFSMIFGLLELDILGWW